MPIRKFNFDKTLDEQIENISSQQFGEKIDYTKELKIFPTKAYTEDKAVFVVRMLPPKTDADIPFVKYIYHWWKDENTGSWINIPCARTISKGDCPVCQYNTQMKNAGVDFKKLINYTEAFVINVLVLESINKSEIGKAKYIMMSKELFNSTVLAKLADKTTPPWDYEKGCDLILNATKSISEYGKSYWDFSGSYFNSPVFIHDAEGNSLSEEQINALEKEMISLKAYLDPFKYNAKSQVKYLETKTGKSWKKFNILSVAAKEVDSSSIQETDIPSEEIIEEKTIIPAKKNRKASRKTARNNAYAVR